MDSNNFELHEFVGGILTAIMEGQSMALHNSIDFIKFVQNYTDDSEENLAAGELISENKKGYLIFRYQKPSVTEPGKMEDFKLEVPLLTILPVPYISIAEAEVDFNFRINAMREIEEHHTHKSQEDMDGNNSLNPQRIVLNGEVANENNDNRRQDSFAASIRINMKLKEQNLGEGIDVAMRELENSIINNEQDNEGKY